MEHTKRHRLSCINCSQSHPSSLKSTTAPITEKCCVVSALPSPILYSVGLIPIQSLILNCVRHAHARLARNRYLPRVQNSLVHISCTLSQNLRSTCIIILDILRLNVCGHHYQQFWAVVWSWHLRTTAEDVFDYDVW